MRQYLDLMESFTYEILLETPQRAAWLTQNFGPKLDAKFKEEEEAGRVPAVVRQQIDAQEPETETQKLVAYIMAADPTTNKAYSRWIALRFLKNNQKLEDINAQLSQQLAIFQRAAQARRVDPNLDAITTFDQLFQVVEPFVTGQREVSANMDKKEKRSTAVDTRVARVWDETDEMREQADVIYDGDDYIIVSPKTQAAATYFGKNTNWCTTAGDTMFAHYHKDGPMFIILRRSDGRKWQFHFASGQFMDERDRPIDLDAWIDENPVAFHALGEARFLAMFANKDRYHRVRMSLRHFAPEVIAAQPDDVLAATITSIKDFKVFPRQRTMTKEFFSAILPRLNPNISARYDETVIPEDQREKILAMYLKTFGRDTAFIDDLLNSHSWLLKSLPAEMQTDEAKNRTAQGMVGWEDIDKYIPKPWTKMIEERYYDNKCYYAPTRVSLADMPDYCKTDANLVPVLAIRPYNISDYASRLTEDFCAAMLYKVINNPHDVEELIEHIPEQFRTKRLLKPIYQRAMDLKNKSDSENRDGYLRAIAQFPHDLWPTKAPKLMGRLATVNPNFHDNPEQFKNRDQAARWVAHHPTKLSELGPEFISKAAIYSAIASPEVSPSHDVSMDRYGEKKTLTLNNNKTAAHLRNVLQDCDPTIVSPSEVGEAVGKLPGDITKFWTGIPQKFLTKGMIDQLLKKGAIPFDNPAFPQDAFTPQNVVARFEAAVPYETKKQEPYTVSGREYHQTVERPNLEGMKATWDQIPDSADKHAILMHLFDAKGGQALPTGEYPANGSRRHSVSYGKTIKYQPIVQIVDKSLLTPDVLTAWLDSIPSYGGDTKSMFKAFPESAYTADNMAIAVEKGLMKKVPDHLQNDDVLINQMKSYDAKKDVDWSKITPDVFIKYINKDPYYAGSTMQFNVPKNSPLRQNADIARAFLAKPKGEGSLYGGVDDSTLHSIYGEDKASTRNWTQDMFDNAAGNIIPLTNIPKQFRSDAVYERSIRTDPDSVNLIPNTAKWLNQHAEKLPDITRARLLSRGVADTDHGWVDYKDAHRTTVEDSPGSYVFTKLKPKGEAMMFFDDEGKCVDALMVDVARSSTGSGYNKSTHMYASKVDRSGYGSHDAVGALKPYRLLVADALEKHPEFRDQLPEYSHGSGGSKGDFSNLHIYPEGKELRAVEKLSRNDVKGTDLTYVTPESNRWGGVKTFMFDGNAGGVIGVIVLEEDGRGVKMTASQLDLKKMPQLLELSRGMASLIKLKNVTSGKNPVFQDSDFFKKLGIRGLGKNEWFSYLGEKIMDSGNLSVWKHDNTATIAHDKLGVLAIGKRTKDGYSRIYLGEDASQYEEAIHKLFTTMRGRD